MPRAEILQYDIRHDRHEKDVRFIAKQLETHLKERFNVLLSTVEYGIKNGHLVRQGTEEPFIESIKRGRDIIQKIDQRTVDIERENAEVTGFEKIDSFLSNPATPLGSKMLSISPEGGEGSKYKHNFYDIFTLKEAQGERYVELSRYSSGLTCEDYNNKLGAKFKHPPQAHPIEFDVRVTAKQIHRELHVGHEYMEPADFEKLWNSPRGQFYVEKYISLKNADSFNACLNAFDEVWQELKRKNNWQFENYAKALPSYVEVRFMEKKEVRQAGGQCPGKSGVDTNNSPFSVSEAANLKPDKYGERTFPCPKCGKTNVRWKEDELLENCQHCGSDEVGCKKD